MGVKPAGTDTQIYWQMPNGTNRPAVVGSGTGKLLVVTTPDNTKLVIFFDLTPRATMAPWTRMAEL
jgi:hypothetical protein